MSVALTPIRPIVDRLMHRDGYRLVYLCLIVAALVMGVSVTASHSLAFSPFDEWMYFDYLNKLPSQGFIRLGEPVGTTAMNWMACNGLQAYGNPVDACGVKPIDYSIFPFKGVQSAQLYTPLFFAPTWVVASAVQAVTGITFLEAARFSGTFWLIGTMAAITAVLRMFKVPSTAAIAVGLLFLATPFTWWTYTFVSTDAPGALIGAVAVLLIERVIRGRLNAWWLAPFFVLAVLIKAVNVIAIGIVLLYAIARLITRYRHRLVWRRPGVWRAAMAGRGPIAPITGTLVAGVAAGIAQVAWTRFIAANVIGLGPVMGDERPMKFADAIGLAWAFIPSMFSTGASELSAMSWKFASAPFVGQAIGWLCVGGVLGLVWLNRQRGLDRTVTNVTLVASVLAGPVLALVFTASVGTYVNLGARYGANLIPLILTSVAIMVSGRLHRRILLVLAAVCYVFVVAVSVADALTR